MDPVALQGVINDTVEHNSKQVGGNNTDISSRARRLSIPTPQMNNQKLIVGNNDISIQNEGQMASGVGEGLREIQDTNG